MPLKLNCGFSKKVGEANFGSRGASVNLELEVESDLVASPHVNAAQKVQRRPVRLYRRKNAALITLAR